MTPRKKLAFAAVAVGIVGCLGYWLFYSGDVFATHASNEQNRAALTRIAAEVQPGDRYEAVLASYWRNATPGLTIDTRSQDTWVVKMPPEFGAGDWTLVIAFDGGMVTKATAQTSNGVAIASLAFPDH
jgi:hypothetical protein